MLETQSLGLEEARQAIDAGEAAAIELGLPISCLADEIQLVAYNEAMTWLEEIKSWRAA